MSKKYPLHFIFMVILFVAFLTLIGCTTEEEAFEMDTDEEFQQALEIAVERFLRNDDPNTIINDLNKLFAERYSEEEIEAYLSARVEEEMAEIETQREELEQRIAEAEKNANELKSRLEDKLDEEAFEKTNENLKPLYDWLEKLDDKIEEASDPGRIVELMEEKINTYNQLSSIITDKLDSQKESSNSSNQEKNDYLEYYHSIEYILEKEEAVLADYERVTGDNYISDQVIHDQLRKSIISEARDLYDQLRRVRVGDSKIENLHETYTKAWDLKRQGFMKLAEAIQINDSVRKADAEDLIEEGSRLREEFHNELERLL